MVLGLFEILQIFILKLEFIREKNRKSPAAGIAIRLMK